jgi:hypothetical protein
MANVSAHRNWSDARDRSGHRGPSPETLREADEMVERIAWLMDRSIPIGNLRIGLDPIIGLIPGLGDLVGAAISTGIIIQAHRVGVHRSTLLRMVANVAIDTAVGSIPVLGDAFDFWFKVNERNLLLYRESRAGMRDTRRDTGFLAALLVGLAAIVALPVVAVAWLIQALL